MRLSLLFLLLPFMVFGQQKINGRILNAEDDKPIENASIFLANATVGNVSNADGYFVLYAVRPGQYELVVSVMGFDAYHTMVLISGTDIDLKDIKLTPKAIELNEVTVTPDKNWFEKYDLFKREFLGSSNLAKKCRILNPEVLSLQFEDKKNLLTGSSYDFLEIDNDELGYKIKYLLNKFIRNRKTGVVYYEGSPFFEETKGKQSKVKKWQKNRFKAYLGSSMHFLRTVIQNRLSDEHFEVRRLIRPNDSIKKSIGNVQMLVKTPLTINQFVLLTEQKGIYALGFDNHLYVMYTLKHDRHTLRPYYQHPDAPDYFTSIIGFEQQYAFFDSNGVIINPESVMFEGVWAGQRLAELLPVDYVPPASK